MGWLGNFLGAVAGASPVDMTIVSLDNTNLPRVDEGIVADECYIELFVESLRLKKARRFNSKFNGVVYSFVALPRLGDTKAEIASVSKPEKLARVDSSSLDRVITVSKQMMAPVPWRGGVLSLQLGLFSVKAGDVLTPVLEYVTKVSEVAGISFVGAVRPFVPLITQGMDLIAGQKADTAIEVAIDTDLSLKKSGAFAIIAASKASIDVTRISLDSTDNKLLLDGSPLEEGYCVFSIRRASEKPDFGEIPELREKFEAVQGAIRANKRQDAQDALTAFRLATIASPDLISADAKRLVEKVSQRVIDAFPAGGVSQLTGAEASKVTLGDIDLYTK